MYKKPKQCKCGKQMTYFDTAKAWICDCKNEIPLEEKQNFADSLKIYNEFPTKLQK